MAIPINIFEMQVLLALLCTAFSWFVHDDNNYTDIIGGVVAVIFWWTSGLSMLIGIVSESETYTATWLCWILLGIGVIVDM
jgi:hypothetical protein